MYLDRYLDEQERAGRCLLLFGRRGVTDTESVNPSPAFIHQRGSTHLQPRIHYCTRKEHCPYIYISMIYSSNQAGCNLRADCGMIEVCA